MFQYSTIQYTKRLPLKEFQFVGVGAGGYMGDRSPIVNLGHSPSTFKLNYMQLECGPMPNVMVALPNIGDALCSTLQVWMTLTT